MKRKWVDVSSADQGSTDTQTTLREQLDSVTGKSRTGHQEETRSFSQHGNNTMVRQGSVFRYENDIYPPPL
jgi:hypothetical protein